MKRISMLIFLLASQQTFALPEDETKPIEINADRAEYNEQQGTAVYIGNVTMHQGSMEVTAAKVTVYQSEGEDLKKIIAEGSPAKYQQKPAHDKKMVYAYGKTIEYDVKNKRVYLKQQAKLEQEGNTFTGDNITYDMNKKVVNASSHKSGRVNMVIQPKAIKKSK